MHLKSSSSKLGNSSLKNKLNMKTKSKMEPRCKPSKISHSKTSKICPKTQKESK